MFREICLHPEEKDLHRFFRRKPDGKIQICRMNRLTFGIRSSPFIATRVIRHLAEQHSSSHPLASEAILTSFYFDDFLSGANSVEDADVLRKELCQLLSTAGMTLRKWRSNSDEFKRTIPDELLESTDLLLPSPLSAPKALGLHWEVSQDTLHVDVPVFEKDEKVTKRFMASCSAKIFDVLGLFTPATITGKVLLQEAWKCNVDWDQEVPDSLVSKWQNWIEELPAIASTPIPRRLQRSDSKPMFSSLHGFADASNLAYGSVVYLRTVHEDTTISTTILYSKSRVTPIKKTTIPRLELSAAVLLAKLLQYLQKIYNIQEVYAWSDSEITLCWLRKSPTSWKTYVSHRVAAIQKIVPSSKWRHVPSKENPADLVSRGVQPSTLPSNSLWWEGPHWLKLPPQSWPSQKKKELNSVPETKSTVLLTQARPKTVHFWENYSSFHRLVRVTAWIKRFLLNCKLPSQDREKNEVLTSEEIYQAKTMLLRQSQLEIYEDIIELVKANKGIPKSHPLHHYDLSIDTENILRLSGRVRQKENKKCPLSLIPLSLKSYLTKLYVGSLHKDLFHPSLSSLLCVIASTYHITGLKKFLKSLYRCCVTCQKIQARPLVPAMGMLPAERTTPSAPFTHTGLDFAGPLQIRQGHTRRPVILKAYVCVFVCFVTKAIHLELCADLTTKEFMSALRRFCSRRGTPCHLYSDNGTSFVGANNELKNVKQLLHSRETESAISHFSTTTAIQWHFIPPRAPHFGGLWEAAVKSMKMLLRKIVGSNLLTFQELATILTEAEAILNSRPITPMYSTDADSPLALTAGHFLIGRPLIAPPRKETKHIKNCSLYKRWNLVQRLQEDLYETLSANYIQSLNARTKWHKKAHNLQTGDIVLVLDDMLKIQNWPLARVQQTFGGDDGIVRAVDLQCQGKTYRRAAHQLVLLLPEIDQCSSSS